MVYDAFMKTRYKSELYRVRSRMLHSTKAFLKYVGGGGGTEHKNRVHFVVYPKLEYVPIYLLLLPRLPPPQRVKETWPLYF